MAVATARRAQPSDADGIARVWVSAWRIAYRGLVPDEVLDALSLHERQERWRARLSAGDPEAASIYVLPEHRRTGVGSTLMSAALHELRRDGWRDATLALAASRRH